MYFDNDLKAPSLVSEGRYGSGEADLLQWSATVGSASQPHGSVPVELRGTVAGSDSQQSWPPPQLFLTHC